MGLLAVITGDDLELPYEVSGSVQGIPEGDSDSDSDSDYGDDDQGGGGFFGGFQIHTVQIDYSNAFEVFAEAFVAAAQSMVPVDTGYLMSTIGADSDDWSVSAYADAEYAQYVEFGTWKMAEQPYFIPALEQAWDESAYAFQQAIEDAQAQLGELINEDLNDMGGGFDVGGFLGLFSAIVAAIFSAIIMGMIRTMFTMIGQIHGTKVEAPAGGDFESFVEIT